MVLANQLPSYTLMIRDVSPDLRSLQCHDSTTGVLADIDDVKFWRNRTLPNDPGLRETGDVHVYEDHARNIITFELRRKYEGRYTCGQQQMGDSSRVIESPPVPLVCKLPY